MEKIHWFKIKLFPEIGLFRAHIMFKRFFDLINAKEKSSSLKSIA